jgi:hypothetical protein
VIRLSNELLPAAFVARFRVALPGNRSVCYFVSSVAGLVVSAGAEEGNAAVCDGVGNS